MPNNVSKSPSPKVGSPLMLMLITSFVKSLRRKSSYKKILIVPGATIGGAFLKFLHCDTAAHFFNKGEI